MKIERKLAAIGVATVVAGLVLHLYVPFPDPDATVLGLVLTSGNAFVICVGAGYLFSAFYRATF